MLHSLFRPFNSARFARLIRAWFAFLYLICSAFESTAVSEVRFAAQLAVHQKLAAASLGSTVYVIDITSQVQPRLLSQVKLPRAVQSLALNVPTLFAGMADGGLQLINLQDPVAPVNAPALE